MSKFIMLVGPPASGKSTWAAAQHKIVVSSDDIRDEYGLNGQNKEDNTKVFSIMHTRAIDAMKNKEDVIYDATCVSRRDRNGIMQTINKMSRTYDVKKIAHVFLASPETLKKRNSVRSRVVPDFVIDRMLARFQMPIFSEGFDESWFHSSGEVMSFDQMLDGFTQDNPHHSLTLKDHLQVAALHVAGDPVLEHAAQWHDVGKLFTKSFTDSKGNPTNVAHYYGHENYGAYLYLLNNIGQTEAYTGREFSRESSPYKAMLINWHMRPHVWDENPGVKEKDARLLSLKCLKDLEKLHSADLAAH